MAAIVAALIAAKCIKMGAMVTRTVLAVARRWSTRCFVPMEPGEVGMTMTTRRRTTTLARLAHVELCSARGRQSAGGY
ncbi:hypothetical protein CJ010_21445 [Azoarcus sp. DD4]|nr:hypothetical protein CJ010_21445 [Azoarcus sp. DD4]